MLDGASGVKRSGTKAKRSGTRAKRSEAEPKRSGTKAKRYFKRQDGNYCKKYKVLGWPLRYYIDPHQFLLRR
jgi:hypothetical protein